MARIQWKESLTLAWGLLAICLAVRAQVTTATLYGTVLDPAGAVIPAARVQATNMQTSVSVSGATNENGNFTIPFVPIGAYTVTCSAPGHTSQSNGLVSCICAKNGRTSLMKRR